MSQLMDDKTLRLLEERTSLLEEKLIGPLPRDENYPEVIPMLACLGSKLGNALSNRDRMMMVMKRLDELMRYMDPTYGDVCEVTDSMKIDLILSQEEQLRTNHENLNELHRKKKVLDSESITNAASLSNELIGLSKKHDEIDESAKNQAGEITALLDKYNSIICTITETLVKMDDIVLKAEERAAKKNIIDD